MKATLALRLVSASYDLLHSKASEVLPERAKAEKEEQVPSSGRSKGMIVSASQPNRWRVFFANKKIVSNSTILNSVQ
ncbi:MAG: hypothetical protein COA36_15380 [Desulfotalea sp.]|nr:MAG: hypothetical protein COA36_15380 [Desulfotalea sp.]